LRMLKAKTKRGSEKSILPPIKKSKAITIDKINTTFLITMAIFLLLLFTNQESKENTKIK